nr:YbaK/EbsC family protein [Brevibacterium daeguense]
MRFLDAETHTAKAAAEHLGVALGAIANSLVFSADGEPVLIMTSGAHRVDTEFVADRIGRGKLRRADPAMVRAATGQVIGGVAPCGHPAPVETYVDIALAEFPVIWAAGGTADSLFPLRYDQLLALTDGREIPVEPD